MRHHEPMKLITLLVPEEHLRAVDELVRKGKYSSRSYILRSAIRLFLIEQNPEGKASPLHRALKDMKDMKKILKRLQTQHPELFL